MKVVLDGLGGLGVLDAGGEAGVREIEEESPIGERGFVKEFPGVEKEVMDAGKGILSASTVVGFGKEAGATGLGGRDRRVARGFLGEGAEEDAEAVLVGLEESQGVVEGFRGVFVSVVHEGLEEQGRTREAEETAIVAPKAGGREGSFEEEEGSALDALGEGGGDLLAEEVLGLWVLEAG